MCVGCLKAMLLRLIPLFAFFRKPSIILKSFAYSPLTLTDRLQVAVRWRSLSRLMKWWMKGRTSPRWTKRPMCCSISFAVADPSWMIFSIADVQALNLLSGIVIQRQQKSRNHPTIIFCSSNIASTASLSLASIVLRGLGSFRSRGKHMCWKQGGERNHSWQDCLSLRFQLLGIQGHWCKYPTCLSSQSRCQQPVQALLWMGLSLLRIWGGEQDAGFYQKFSLAPNRHSAWWQWWDCRRFPRWCPTQRSLVSCQLSIVGSSVWGHSLEVGLLSLWQSPNLDAFGNKLTWSCPSSQGSSNLGIFFLRRLPNWLVLTGIFRICTAEGGPYQFGSWRSCRTLSTQSSDCVSIGPSWLSLPGCWSSIGVGYSRVPCTRWGFWRFCHGGGGVRTHTWRPLIQISGEVWAGLWHPCGSQTLGPPASRWSFLPWGFVWWAIETRWSRFPSCKNRGGGSSGVGGGFPISWIQTCSPLETWPVPQLLPSGRN